MTAAQPAAKAAAHNSNTGVDQLFLPAFGSSGLARLHQVVWQNRREWRLAAVFLVIKDAQNHVLVPDCGIGSVRNCCLGYLRCNGLDGFALYVRFIDCSDNGRFQNVHSDNTVVIAISEW